MDTRLLCTVFTARKPDWTRFRGASYCGVATHDPLEQALFAHMLARSAPLSRLPAWLRMYIAMLACSGRFPATTPRMLRLVCKADRDCERLIVAARISKQLRRLFTCVPRGCSLWRLYHSWTYDVALAVGAVPIQKTMGLGTDPCAARLTVADRLHVRGFTRLHVMKSFAAARPAYFPTAALIQDWAQRLRKEFGSDTFSRTMAQITECTRRSNVLIEHQVLRGNAINIKKDTGCLDLVTQHVDAAALYHKKMYLANVQHVLLDLAARLYVQLNRLGLNAAERDYVYMLSADEHDDHDPACSG